MDQQSDDIELDSQGSDVLYELQEQVRIKTEAHIEDFLDVDDRLDKQEFV